jgi:hypothetical protein
MSESETLNALLAQSKRQADLLAVLALPHARELAESVLKGEKERLVYSLSDGEHSTRQIGAETRVPKSTVATWWKQWRNLGLAVEDHRGVRAIFPLEQLWTRQSVHDRQGTT